MQLKRLKGILRPRERARQILDEKLEEMHPGTRLAPPRPTMTMSERGIALMIALAKAQVCLENRLIGLASSKNGDMDIHSFLRVVRDYNQLTLAQWKIQQRNRGP